MEMETKAGDRYTGIVENIEEDENAGVYELYKDDEFIELDEHGNPLPKHNPAPSDQMNAHPNHAPHGEATIEEEKHQTI